MKVANKFHFDFFQVELMENGCPVDLTKFQSPKDLENSPPLLSFQNYHANFHDFVLQMPLTAYRNNYLSDPNQTKEIRTADRHN